ncbi:Smr/MutS family protein [Autumnicola psychrophila]|uniref:DNA mismatch repair protein MutS n=1 Tax=Autumnicola psychrophila TaxID=3075592 RepID=A0ABU3DQ38_9FLAO|nr:Smr/MutS family protein [Zunongwangia sp. F225]MDT0685826.1 DNA mismatch repair protein MutS [Zunongwangia sp. F225]
MDFRKGDKVEVLDDNLEGVVVSNNGNMIEIETSEGFNMEFPASDLVKIETPIEDFQENVDFNQILEEKKVPRKHNSQRIKPKERNAPPMEVDLHIHKLTKSARGLSNYEMLDIQIDTARRQLEFAMEKRIQKIVFIHGVGEGVLKAELDYLFGRYANVKFYDADFKKYGLGATEVYIFQNVRD